MGGGLAYIYIYAFCFGLQWALCERSERRYCNICWGDYEALRPREASRGNRQNRWNLFPLWKIQLPCEGSKLDLGTNPEAGSQETRVRGSIPGIPENWRNWWNWWNWCFSMLLVSGIFNLFTSTRSCGVNASDHETCGVIGKSSVI